MNTAYLGVRMDTKAQTEQLKLEVEKLTKSLAEAQQLNHVLTEQGQELVKVQTVLHSLLHTATDPIIQFEPDGTIINFNSAAQRAFGYSEIELLYHTAEKIISCPPKYNGNVPLFLLDCQQNMPSKSGVIPLMAMDRDGRHLCMECSISYVKEDDMMLFDDDDDDIDLFDDNFSSDDEEGADLTEEQNSNDQIDKYSSVMLILRNVTERVQVEKDLIDAINQTEQALSVKSSFIATISHELRTPMNGIIGGLQILRDAALDSEFKSVLKTITTSSENLLEIINDVLDFSKIDAGKMTLHEENFSIAYLTEDVIEMFIYAIQEKDLQLDYHIDSSVPTQIYCDPVKIKQILVNLIGNAVKFTVHGRIGVDISYQKQSDQEGFGQLSIVVSDTGVGISAEDIDKLFQPFQQADSSITRDFGGTGLGLSICKNIALLMNGDIFIESELGKGSHFNFVIPIDKSRLTEDSSLFEENVVAGKSTLVYSTRPQFLASISNRCERWGIETRMHKEIGNVVEDLKQLNHDWFVTTSDNITEIKSLLESDYDVSINGLIVSGPNDKAAWVREVMGEMPLQYLTQPVFTKHLRDALVSKQQQIKPAREEKYNQTICITDDNLVNRTILSKVLARLGCTSIVLAKDGQQAIEVIKEHSPVLVFMDLQMPVMDGLTASKIIMTELENPPVIVALTANVSQEDQSASTEVGMVDFLTKPVRMEKIQSILIKYLSG